MVDPETLSRMSAAAIGRSIAAHELCPVELAEFYLSRIEGGVAPHAFLSVTRDRALLQARAARERARAGRSLSPLDGVPVALKDLLDMRGEVTTAGSALCRDAAPAARDAVCVANLDRAGMVFLGKTNLTEFAYSGIGLNPHFGTPATPYDPQTPRAPGGSSSGSAVAVAANLAPCAIGTDTGGSVRVPSALNGLVGFKTGEGRIPKGGVFALSPTLDTVGPMARSVEDCFLLDAALRGVWERPEPRGPLQRLRLFVPETVVLDELDPGIGENFEAAIDRLATGGADVSRASMPLMQEIFDIGAAHGNITAIEAYAEHKAIVDGPDAGRIDRRVLARIEPGKSMSALDLLMVQRARKRLQAALAQVLDGRLLAMPTTAIVAPEIAALEADDAVFHRTNLRALRNTLIGNFLDTPGLTLPSGTDATGLPTGLLLSTVGGDEARLLMDALTAERMLCG